MHSRPYLYDWALERLCIISYHYVSFISYQEFNPGNQGLSPSPLPQCHGCCVMYHELYKRPWHVYRYCCVVILNRNLLQPESWLASIIFGCNFSLDWHSDFITALPMLSSPHPWQRPPALEISAAKVASLTIPSDGLLAAGALSPDVQPNSPPSFIPQVLGSVPASWLKIGNYLLTERLPDMTAGVAVYSAVHVETREKFTCRVRVVMSVVMSDICVILYGRYIVV